ncbi:MAG TPA: polysaccharide deacetylase family protein [Solirubrobacteraceae bacterium]|nr:polysaccharide deacetylase family protein [Solirubrobacteraceae bacterium]
MAHIVIRYVLAPHIAPFARALEIPRTLGELAAASRPVASGPLAAEEHPHPARWPQAVAITFDDGPHPEGTPRMLEILAEHDARATFFLVGEQVVKRPELARRILDGGHAIGMHGYLHRPHPTRKAAALADDFERAIAATADATGIAPHLHRPPYGVYSPVSLRIVRERGLQPLMWDRWGKDWRKFTTPRRITRRVVAGLRAGDVILLHDADFYSSQRSYQRTAAALPMILETLKSAELGTVACV